MKRMDGIGANRISERSANAASSSLRRRYDGGFLGESSTLSMDPLRSKKHAVESRVRSVNKSERRLGLAQSSEENEEEDAEQAVSRD